METLDRPELRLSQTSQTLLRLLGAVALGAATFAAAAAGGTAALDHSGNSLPILGGVVLALYFAVTGPFVAGDTGMFAGPSVLWFTGALAGAMLAAFVLLQVRFVRGELRFHPAAVAAGLPIAGALAGAALGAFVHAA